MTEGKGGSIEDRWRDDSRYRPVHTPAKREREPGLPADYGDATPEEVARAVLTYRPPKARPTGSQP